MFNTNNHHFVYKNHHLTQNGTVYSRSLMIRLSSSFWTFSQIVSAEFIILNTKFIILNTKFLVLNTKSLVFDAKCLVFNYRKSSVLLTAAGCCAWVRSITARTVACLVNIFNTKTRNSVLKTRNFCIKNEEFCSKNEEFCSKNEELCIKNGEYLVIYSTTVWP